MCTHPVCCRLRAFTAIATTIPGTLISKSNWKHKSVIQAMTSNRFGISKPDHKEYPNIYMTTLTFLHTSDEKQIHWLAKSVSPCENIEISHIHCTWPTNSMSASLEEPNVQSGSLHLSRGLANPFCLLTEIRSNGSETSCLLRQHSHLSRCTELRK